MLKCIFKRFSTFVLTLLLVKTAHGNPHEHAPLLNTNSSIPEEKQIHDLKTEDVGITKVKETRPSPRKLNYYPFLQSASPYMGVLFDSKHPDDLDYALGLYYMFPKYESPQLEIGFALNTNSTAFLSATKRFIINERDHFRPYYKFGLGHLLESEKQLGTFVSSKNYFLKLGSGIEDLLSQPRSIRLEIELSAGLDSIYVQLNFGYSWGW